MQLISLFLFSSHSARTSKQYPGSNHQPTSALMPSRLWKALWGLFWWRYISPIYRRWLHSLSTHSEKILVSKGIYRQYIGTGCTRTVLARKIIVLRFSTLVATLYPISEPRWQRDRVEQCTRCREGARQWKTLPDSRYQSRVSVAIAVQWSGSPARLQ